MAITVGGLLEMPRLRLSLHSGSGGLERDVLWTHTSDLPDPWHWLVGGELLLTNGMSFPAEGAEQRVLIERLVDAGASALAIGEKMYCPPLTDELAEASERLSFSVLTVEYPMPFVAISQTVAVANLLEQSDRLIRTEQIYRTVQRMVSADDDASVLSAALAQVLDCEVHVCHRASGRPWYPKDPRFDPMLTDALGGEAGGADLRAGAFAVTLADGREIRLVDVPTQSSAVLVLVSRRRNLLDAILMQHAVTVIALELSQALVGIEHRRRLGAELLAQLMDARFDERSGRRQLRSAGVDVSRATLFAISSSVIEPLREVHVALWRDGIAHVVVYRSGVLYVLSADPDRVETVIRSDLGDDAIIGISAPVRGVDRIPEAVREATWAAHAAIGVGGRTFQYGDATPLLGVAGIDDSAAWVARVLGALLEHERVHKSGLLATLEAFLENRRSWQRTADALHVHRQTVLYRIRKVEEITKLDLDDTRDIAQVWLALQARALLSPDEPTAPVRPI